MFNACEKKFGQCYRIVLLIGSSKEVLYQDSFPSLRHTVRFCDTQISTSLDRSSIKTFQFQISDESVVLPFWFQKQFCIFKLRMLHCVNLVTITKHIFTDISQINHLSAVKFYMGNEKNMRNLLITKSQKVWKKIIRSDGRPLIGT